MYYFFHGESFHDHKTPINLLDLNTHDESKSDSYRDTFFSSTE